MVTQLTKISEQQEEAICSLAISLHPDCDSFFKYIWKMEGALSGEGYVADFQGANNYQLALNNLTVIEDAIKRFRDNRKQAFEED